MRQLSTWLPPSLASSVSFDIRSKDCKKGVNRSGQVRLSHARRHACLEKLFDVFCPFADLIGRLAISRRAFPKQQADELFKER
jgi:hypothetical protein